jgi:hypothetical protein
MSDHYVVCDVCDLRIYLGEKARFYTDESRGHPLIIECDQCVDFNLLETIQPLTQEQWMLSINHNNLMNQTWCRRCETTFWLGDKAVIPVSSGPRIYYDDEGRYCFGETMLSYKYTHMLCPPCAICKKNKDIPQVITQQIIDDFLAELEAMAER